MNPAIDGARKPIKISFAGFPMRLASPARDNAYTPLKDMSLATRRRANSAATRRSLMTAELAHRSPKDREEDEKADEAIEDEGNSGGGV